MRRIYENEIQDAARHLADLIICNDEKIALKTALYTLLRPLSRTG